MIAAGFPIVSHLVVRYFKITAGTSCPPDGGLPAEECHQEPTMDIDDDRQE
jgi:hypothetical protein